jgi:hypothetical protein
VLRGPRVTLAQRVASLSKLCTSKRHMFVRERWSCWEVALTAPDAPRLPERRAAGEARRDDISAAFATGSVARLLAGSTLRERAVQLAIDTAAFLPDDDAQNERLALLATVAAQALADAGEGEGAALARPDELVARCVVQRFGCHG